MPTRSIAPAPRKVDIEDLLTVEQAAQLLRTSRQTVRRRIADGSLPALRIPPRSVRIRRGDLEALLRAIPHA